MGYWKRMKEQQDEQREAALALALRAGVLKECPVCGDVVDRGETWDLEPAYRLGNALITRGDPGVAVFEGARRVMTDTVQETVGAVRDTCHCSHVAQRDD